MNVFVSADFCNSTQSLRFTIKFQVVSSIDADVDAAAVAKDRRPVGADESLSLEIKSPVGELFSPLVIGPADFVAKQGEGSALESRMAFDCQEGH